MPAPGPGQAPDSGLPRSLSVVIPTRNRRQRLMRLLDSLALQSLPGARFEVVVVNDGSGDATREYLNARRATSPYRLLVLDQDHAGPAAARNLGVAAGLGEVVVFVDDDMLLSPEFLQAHLRSHQRRAPQSLTVTIGRSDWPAAFKVTPFMRYVGEQGPQFAFADLEAGVTPDYRHYYTANLSVSRVLLETQASLFDETFTTAGFEDTELGWRLQQAGARAEYEPRALAWHDHPTSIRAFCARQARAGKNARTLLKRHPDLAPVVAGVSSPERQALRDAVAPAALPVAHLLDSLGVPLPGRIYGALLRSSFARGNR